MRLQIVIIGLSVTSSWGNGHATVYRALMGELTKRGHQVIFLERDKPWYANNRDKSDLRGGSVFLYHSVNDLKRRFEEVIRSADCVIVGSYVPEGIAIGNWVTSTAGGITAFYDIDTPVTQSLVSAGQCEYLTARLISRYSLYLSFTGGPILEKIERTYGSAIVRAFFCCVDASQYYPEPRVKEYDLGYLGTYSEDRQRGLERLLLSPATIRPSSSFIVAGPMYPEAVQWPANVHRVDHVAPGQHRAFYNSQRFTLNLTRADMIRWGYSPSVRLFEAAACGVPIISDNWPGIREFFLPGEEILTAHSAKKVLEYLWDIEPQEAQEIAERGRRRVLREHTAAHRVAELEKLIANVEPITPPTQETISYEMQRE